ncbi:glycosyltransferase family 2 protein [Canibacter zhoujuaniae]|uniref:glycosyltransferase family 2 protein n=1 Tax=Canibacter zhoujuaniae TaxID=2708343 RepID=UPI001FB98666|nr:glycosyltransferase family 2 protein [Canibacter zhoujuaniae]
MTPAASLMLPPVSFVMPVLNEAAYIAEAVASIFAQNYPNEFELLLVLGNSTDGTTALAAELAEKHPQIRLINNPTNHIPTALNLGFNAAKHSVIVRVDAHSKLNSGYVERAVTELLRTGAANIGGVMRAAGRTRKQQAIADCYNSPFGLGGGVYHGEAPAGEAESAYLGVFNRATVVQAGGFDETILRGEDWELNRRIRNLGEKVWFDPQLKVTYYPRDSFRALAKQFWATGVWRAVIMRRYLSEHPARFFAPGLLVAALLFSTIITVIGGVGFANNGNPTLLFLGLALPVSYLLGLIFAVFTMRPQNIRAALLRLSALPVMHLSWGLGFWRGFLFGGGSSVDRSRLR